MDKIKNIYKSLPYPVKMFLGPIKWSYGIFASLNKEIRLDVNLISGKLRNHNLDLKVLVAGKGKSLSYMINKFFEENYKTKYLGKESIWNLSRRLKDSEDKYDLILMRLHKILIQSYSNNGFYVLPTHIRQKLNLDLPPDRLKEKFRKNVHRSDLRQLRKYKYTYSISHEESKLRYFYDEMYIPYIHQRFSKLASISKYEVIKGFFNKGGLLIVTYQDNPVCAYLFTMINKEYYARVMGTTSQGLNLLNNGILSALYYYSIIYAKEAGCQRIDLGKTRPFLNDGIFFHKRKWGSYVAKNADSGHYCLLKINRLNNTTKQLLMDNPFISQKRNKFIANVFDFDRQFKDESFQKDLETRYSTPGVQLECTTKDKYLENNHLPFTIND